MMREGGDRGSGARRPAKSSRARPVSRRQRDPGVAAKRAARCGAMTWIPCHAQRFDRNRAAS